MWRLLLPFIPLSALAWSIVRDRLRQPEAAPPEPMETPEPQYPPEPPVQAAKRCDACPEMGCKPPAPGCLWAWHPVYAAHDPEPITWVRQVDDLPPYVPQPADRVRR